MRDSVLGATIAGVAGAAVVDGLTAIARAAGLPIAAPWRIAADVFLASDLIGTPLGTALGIVGTLALSTATAITILLVLGWTGCDLAWLKGLVCANGFGFLSLGAIMPALDIYPAIQHQSLTNLAALVGLSLLGIVQALILARWLGGRSSVRPKANA